MRFARVGPTLMKKSLNLLLIKFLSFVIDPSLSLNLLLVYFSLLRLIIFLIIDHIFFELFLFNSINSL